MAETLRPNVAQFIKGPLQHYINGQWRSSKDGAVDDVIDPSTGKPICKVAMGGPMKLTQPWQRHTERFTPGRPKRQMNGV